MENNEIKPTIDYGQVVKMVRSNFKKEIDLMGTDFMVLRPKSIIDILFQKKAEIENTSDVIVKLSLFAIINYSVIGHIRLGMDNENSKPIPTDEALSLYEKVLTSALKRMVKSNYPEILESFTLETFNEELANKITDLRKRARNADFKNKEIGEEFLDIINLSIFSLMIIEN